MKKKRIITACAAVLTCLVMCICEATAQHRTDKPNEALVLFTGNWFQQGVGSIEGPTQFRPYLFNLVTPYCFDEYEKSRASSVAMDIHHRQYVSVHTFFLDGDLNLLVITENPQKRKVVKYYFWPKEFLTWPQGVSKNQKITAIMGDFYEWEPAVYIPKSAGKTPSAGDYYISLLERDNKVNRLLLQQEHVKELRQKFALDFPNFPFSK